MGSGASDSFLPVRRVLMTGDAAGEPWEMTVELTRALAGAGCEVHLALLGDPPSAGDRDRLAALPRVVLHQGGFDLDPMADPGRECGGAGEWLLDLEASVRPGLVHLNHASYGALPWRNPAVVAVHGCLLARWLAVHDEAAPPCWDAHRRATAAGLRRARAVAAASRSLLRSLEMFCGWHAPGRVIPYGRDPAGYEPARKEPFVYCAGDLADAALNAAALGEVAREIAWPVYIRGAAAPSRGQAEPPDGTVLLGELPWEEHRRWLARAAVFARPARYDPFGIAVLDAALSGCALVLGDIPSLAEVWGDAALYVPAGERPALRQALRRLIQEPALRRRLGTAARERGLSYSARRMLAGYLELYRSVAAPAGPMTALTSAPWSGRRGRPTRAPGGSGSCAAGRAECGRLPPERRSTSSYRSRPRPFDGRPG